uniref:Uncharacterized protein n=1 Tax=uncultured bacterium 293 TaxID=698389 RepID=E3T616_9BACT|nr:hypothetical protein [uncultured bacterium 293]
MAKVAVFASAPLRRHLQGAGAALAYTFFPPLGADTTFDSDGFSGALVEIEGGGPAPALKRLREAMPRQPVGSVSLRSDAKVLKRSARLGFDFHVASWGAGDPPAREVLAHLEAARARETAGTAPARGGAAAQAHHAAPRHPHRHREGRQLDPGAAQGHRADHAEGAAAHPLRGLVHAHAGRGEGGAHLRAGPG